MKVWNSCWRVAMGLGGVLLLAGPHASAADAHNPMQGLLHCADAFRLISRGSETPTDLYVTEAVGDEKAAYVVALLPDEPAASAVVHAWVFTREGAQVLPVDRSSGSIYQTRVPLPRKEDGKDRLVSFRWDESERPATLRSIIEGGFWSETYGNQKYEKIFKGFLMSGAALNRRQKDPTVLVPPAERKPNDRASRKRLADYLGDVLEHALGNSGRPSVDTAPSILSKLKSCEERLGPEAEVQGLRARIQKAREAILKNDAEPALPDQPKSDGSGQAASAARQ